MEGEYAAGAPEQIIEVASSSRNRDLGPKLRLYERMGVREYLVALVKTQEFIWHELVDGKFQTIPPDPDGIFRSHFFPGLWLDSAALWRIDLPPPFCRSTTRSCHSRTRRFRHPQT